MGQTLGYHITISGYGLWLPGDDRGSWSEAWDGELGYVEPHMLHEADAQRRRMANERMKHPPVGLDRQMIQAVVKTLGDCAAESAWKLAAASVESSHTHLLLTYTARDIDTTIKWLKDCTTKGIHQATAHRGPVWCKGRWCSFIYEMVVWNNTVSYIERHNIRRGVGARPYSFLE